MHKINRIPQIVIKIMTKSLDQFFLYFYSKRMSISYHTEYIFLKLYFTIKIMTEDTIF